MCWFDVPVFIEAKETLTPDFTKSKSQKVKEHATDAADRIARYVESPLVLPKYITYHQAKKYLFVIYLATRDAQPDSKKSIPQAVIDKAQRASDRVRRKLGLKHHLI